MLLNEDKSPQAVAEMLTKYGDITVVKTAKAQYWVEFEDLKSSKQFKTIK